MFHWNMSNLSIFLTLESRLQRYLNFVFLSYQGLARSATVITFHFNLTLKKAVLRFSWCNISNRTLEQRKAGLC